ncbi:Uncharacterized protein DAT39_021443 [Clarias magur]|uniref:Uncharacterized protein n=1 Tax=Clarias magur TaxID=1594786 RepID=A0A8J4WQM1_CLAMG|nr:Uncharacterized protein DAT39_021443 [Clarias magur]
MRESTRCSLEPLLSVIWDRARARARATVSAEPVSPGRARCNKALERVQRLTVNSTSVGNPEDTEEQTRRRDVKTFCIFW